MKKIILIDFSKVVSPIGISKFLSSNLEKYLSITQEEIRKIYKKNIWKLFVWKYSIFNFIDEISIYLKNPYTKKDIEKTIYTIPTLDTKILKYIATLKKDYTVCLISDIYKELWEEIRKKLSKYFDNYIFSYEERYKKSQKQFWEKIQKKIKFENCILFLDDKKENIDLAKTYWIDGLVYDNFEEAKEKIKAKL